MVRRVDSTAALQAATHIVVAVGHAKAEAGAVHAVRGRQVRRMQALAHAGHGVERGGIDSDALHAG